VAQASRLKRLLAAGIATILIAPAAYSQQSNTPPTTEAVELAFWQSSERIGTIEAYRSYLGRYPNGTFASLAKAALNNAVNLSNSSASAPLPVRPATSPKGTLRVFKKDPQSGSVTHQIGQIFEGPVAVTAGWLGARKQLVLPEGQWIALAARDRYQMFPHSSSMALEQRVKIADVAFGKFDGSQLSSVLLFSFSAEKTMPLVWSMLNCSNAESVALRPEAATPSGFRDESVALSSQSSPSFGELNDDVRLSVEALGAGFQAQAVLRPCVVFSDRQRGAMRVQRFVWPPAVLAGPTATAWVPSAAELDTARRNYADRLWNWTEAYRQVERQGFLNDIGPVSLPDFDAEIAR
jgi:hypothetical protein